MATNLRVAKVEITARRPARKDGGRDGRPYMGAARAPRIYVDMTGPGESAWDALMPRVGKDDERVALADLAVKAGEDVEKVAERKVAEQKKITRDGYVAQMRVMKAAIAQALGTEIAHASRFSWNAGCSTCRCSPGFVYKRPAGPLSPGDLYEDVHILATLEVA